MIAKVDREGYIGRYLVSYDGQYLGVVERIYTGPMPGSKTIVAAIPFRVSKKSGRPTLWKLVPLLGVTNPDETITVPYNSRTVESAPEFAKTPRVIDKNMTRRLTRHYSTRIRSISLSDAPLFRAPTVGAVLDDFGPDVKIRELEGDTDPTFQMPIPGDMAFSEESEACAWFRAAQIVGIGVQLSGHEDVLEEWREDADELMLPTLGTFSSKMDLPLIQNTLDTLSIQYNLEPEHVDRSMSGDLWVEAHRNSNSIATEAAATLTYVSLFSSHEIVRVAAASQLVWLDNPWHERVVQVLEAGCQSTSFTIQHLAANALIQLDPKSPALGLLQGNSPDVQDGESSHTSIMVHGTWSRAKRWWTPQGDFFHYIKREVSGDLYDQATYFRWEGEWKKSSRSGAAGDLVDWSRHPSHRFTHFETVFAHSHGANVVLNAAQLPEEALKVKLLVLLHPAIVRRNDRQWELILGNIARIFAISSRFDIVVLADRALRILPSMNDKVRKHRVKEWLTHGAAIQSETWQDQNLANEVTHEKLMAEVRFLDIMGTVPGTASE